MLMPILMGLSIFIAMGLMRRTYRQARRREYDGIRWRGIQWQRSEDPAAEDATPNDQDAT